MMFIRDKLMDNLIPAVFRQEKRWAMLENHEFGSVFLFVFSLNICACKCIKMQLILSYNMHLCFIANKFKSLHCSRNSVMFSISVGHVLQWSLICKKKLLLFLPCRSKCVTTPNTVSSSLYAGTSVLCRRIRSCAEYSCPVWATLLQSPCLLKEVRNCK